MQTSFRVRGDAWLSTFRTRWNCQLRDVPYSAITLAGTDLTISGDLTGSIFIRVVDTGAADSLVERLQLRY